MLSLIKPPKLHKGDKIATVSLAWGIAGEADARWRYDLASSRLKEYFGLECIAAPNSMKGEKYIDENPEARAEDLMWAFEQSDIKGIIANIGGNDSIRMLPFIDFHTIRNHPKVLIGYSNIMDVHLMCLKAGLSTFYGANLLTSFGEPDGVPFYTIKYFENALFHTDPIGVIDSPEAYCCTPHVYDHPVKGNEFHTCGKYELLQGHGIVRGRLLGGIGGDTMLRDNSACASLFAPFRENEDIILFIDDIVAYMYPQIYIDFIRWLDKELIIKNLKALIFGRLDEYPENPCYKNSLRQVLRELNLTDLPIFANMPFGHTTPTCVLPYGAMAEIDCDMATLTILESGCL